MSRLLGAARRLGLVCCLVAPLTARAELQFDVFFGYDGIVREAAWFPVGFEIFNDGPSFHAVVELTAGQLSASQVRRVPVELPTNTRKRFVIPVFAGSGRYAAWDARLIDERGKVRAEQLNLRAKDLASQSFLLGAVPRSFGGAPTFPAIQPKQPELQPQVARQMVEFLPDNPTALEGLDALYLNSEKAGEIKANQAEALLAWLHAGGHLVVGVEQAQDFNAAQWLRQILPCVFVETRTMRLNGELQQWLRTPPAGGSSTSAAAETPPTGPMPDRRLARRYGLPLPPTGRHAAVSPAAIAEVFARLPPDQSFDRAELLVHVARSLGGRVVLRLQGEPLVFRAPRGRGTITVLTFSPEREPFRSWSNRSWFWVRLLDLPGEWFASADFNAPSGQSIDGIFGAMIETRQVRKLPVSWLLALLGVYLLVIGPVDQYVLKKLNRQMLTWITFPAYVVLFSLLIYFIGYKLRAGETEWNQLDVVDVLPRGEDAELRGRTYVSLYSSSNARYPVACDLRHATLRGEFLGYWRGQDAGRTQVEQRDAGFRAEVFVPVWLSHLFVSDWWQRSPPPLTATVTQQGDRYDVSLENRSSQPLSDVRLIVSDRVYQLGSLQPREAKRFTREVAGGTPLRQFVQDQAGTLRMAAVQRQQALGDSSQGRIENLPLAATAASFLSQLETGPDDPVRFIAPQGYDLSSLVARGDAVLTAWVSGQVLAPPLHRFNPPRSQRQTLLRLAVPVDQGG